MAMEDWFPLPSALSSQGEEWRDTLLMPSADPFPSYMKRYCPLKHKKM